MGSPPMDRRTSASARTWSTVSPISSMFDQTSSGYGLVLRGASATRATFMENANESAKWSSSPCLSQLKDPVTGAAEPGSGVQASGMCPSPARSPLVASRPTQPAPGRKTSVHACKSDRSSATPTGPTTGFSSGRS